MGLGKFLGLAALLGGAVYGARALARPEEPPSAAAMKARAAAAAAPPPEPPAGGGVIPRDQAMREIAAAIDWAKAQRPVDEAKVRRLQVALGQFAAQELKAQGLPVPAGAETLGPPAGPPASAPLPARPAPLYPEGLQASFGGKTATVLTAFYDTTRTPATWIYDVRIEPVPVVGSYVWAGKTEVEIKDELARQLGTPVGPAYPPGLTVMRNGKGGLVQIAVLDGDHWWYELKGWGSPITEPELQRLLGGA